jgi:hypothetical protein
MTKLLAGASTGQMSPGGPGQISDQVACRKQKPHPAAEVVASVKMCVIIIIIKLPN